MLRQLSTCLNFIQNSSTYKNMAAFMNIRKKKEYKLRRNTLSEDYRKLYRFSEENVEWLSNYFLEESNERRGGALTPIQQMRIFLRCVSNPGYQNGIAEEIGVHQSTVSNVNKLVLNKIMDKAHLWIQFPQSLENVIAAKEMWSQKNRFPNGIGVIDCTHVRIPKFNTHRDEYINRKGFPSINVQMTCNANEIFTSVNAQWPGSVHDNRIFKNSVIYQVLKNCTDDCVLLGDDGYAISPWIMTPWRNPTTPEQQHYNKIFCKERVIIERCLGQLKARFPILQYKVKSSEETIPSIIVSCVTLHNIAKYLQDEDFNWLQEENFDVGVNGMQNVATNIIRRLGLQKRERITEVLYNQ